MTRWTLPHAVVPPLLTHGSRSSWPMWWGPTGHWTRRDWRRSTVPRSEDLRDRARGPGVL